MDLKKVIEGYKDRIIEETQKLVRIKSVEDQPREGMPFGEGVNNALLSALKLGEELGFKTKNVDGYMGYIEYGEGEGMVGVLGHLDVVPEGKGWDYDPYGAEIANGKIFGRGTMDDKGPIVASIFGLKALKDIGVNPDRRIRILLGTNEETGSKEVPYYLQKEEAPTIGFTPDASFPVINAEKGILSFTLIREFKTAESPIVYIKGGEKVNMVPDMCEVALKEVDKEDIMRKVDAFSKTHGFQMEYEIKDDMLIIRAQGASAHASTPELGRNGIMMMLEFINFYGVCSSEEKEVIQYFAEKIGMEVNGETLGIGLEDSASGKLTVNVGTIMLNDKILSVGFNVRYPVTFKAEDVMDVIENDCKDKQLKIEGLRNSKPLYFEKDHVLVKKLCDVYNRETGDNIEPIAIGGGTYAKSMKNIVAFGPQFPDTEEVIHKPNEYIELDVLMKITKIYAEAIKELSIK